MIFRQLFDSTSSTYSYLLASRHGGEALIIDPVLERVDRYIQLLKELDLRLVKAIDTHLHADHITGLDALRERTRCITVMGEQTKADVVSIRVADGDRVDIEGLSLEALYTPGHTDDSYSYILPDRVFTGDTLLIRGTGRTDFQNGDPRAQYDFAVRAAAQAAGGDAGLSGARLQRRHGLDHRRGEGVQSAAAGQVDRRICRADEPPQPAQSENDGRRRARQYADRARAGHRHRARAGRSRPRRRKQVLGKPDIALIDLREDQERRKDGIIPGSLHVPYPDVEEGLKTEGLLQNLAKGGGKRLIFFCTFGQRSAMAVQAAQAAGLTTSRHIQGGLQAWQQAHGPLTR